jgi:Fic family protein
MSLLEKLKEEMQMKLKGGLYHQTQIKLAYNSNRIEGSQLTEDQTRYIYETNTIGTEKHEAVNIDDIVETVNHFSCFDYMLRTASEQLTEEIIKEYHRILKTGTSQSKSDWFKVGDYKIKPNAVGDTKTTPPSMVKKEMCKLLSSYNEKEPVIFEDIIDFHHNFEKIHPFQDGNGRVGRIIMFRECLANNIIPFIIDDRYKMYYYSGLKEWENERGFLLDTCLSAQDKYKETVNYFLEIL